jgi:hypothetical protein
MAEKESLQWQEMKSMETWVGSTNLFRAWFAGRGVYKGWQTWPYLAAATESCE